MIKYATVHNLLELLSYMNMALPKYYIMWTQYKDGRYGFNFRLKSNGYVSFDLLVKNDFEFELGEMEGHCSELEIEKIVRVFHLGMVALLDYEYKSELDTFVYRKENGLPCD